MFRALLATLFSILVVSSAMSGDLAVFGEQASVNELRRPFANATTPFAPPQGQDTEDIDEQPCLSGQYGQGKTAVDPQLASAVGDHARIAVEGSLLPWVFSKHNLFLHACAPRAPPHATRG